MLNNEQQILSIFEPNGLLDSQIKGFEPRLQQKEMVQSVLESIKNDHNLVVEAGTGTGKTFAYLVPMIKLGRKIVISTGTKNLQDQLTDRDIPFINIILSSNYKVACLKGRANYICQNKLNNIKKIEKKDEFKHLKIVLDSFLLEDDSGDISKISTNLLNEKDKLNLSKFVSKSTTCRGLKCPYSGSCYLREARKKAKESDLLIVNHSLFMSDFLVKKKTDTSMLPNVDSIIFDEAHRLPDVARKCFSTELTSKDLLDLSKELEEYLDIHYTLFETGDEDKPCSPNVETAVKKITSIYKSIELFTNSFCRNESIHLSIRDNANSTKEEPNSSLKEFILLDLMKDSIFVTQLKEFDLKLKTVIRDLSFYIVNYSNFIKDEDHTVELVYSQIKEFSSQFDRVLKDLANPNDDYLITILLNQKKFIIRKTPLDFSNKFADEVMNGLKHVVFTSATISVNKKFDSFTKTLGLNSSYTDFKIFDSPFDYVNQSRFYIPFNGLPSKEDPSGLRAAKVVSLAEPLLKIITGGFFFLSTNINVMNSIYYSLLKSKAIYGRKIYLQGKQSKLDIMRNIQIEKNSIVVATSSFWEGVDVKGLALSCVIIDRLPFPVYTDLYIRALRERQEKKEKGTAFMAIDIPRMVISLKQGVGRLIRSCSDYGVIVIADDRLNQGLSYVNKVLNDLPPFTRTNNLGEIASFWRNVYPKILK